MYKIPRVSFLKRLLAHLVFSMIRISPSGLCATSSAFVAGDWSRWLGKTKKLLSFQKLKINLLFSSNRRFHADKQY